MNKKVKENISVVLPKNWTYSVEESVGLPQGIYAIRNEKGELLYVKPCLKEEIVCGMVFTILNRKQCKELGIEVQETYAGSFDTENYEVEE